LREEGEADRRGQVSAAEEEREARRLLEGHSARLRLGWRGAGLGGEARRAELGWRGCSVGLGQK